MNNSFQSIEAISPTAILVRFKEPISEPKKYLNPSKYLFTNKLEPLGVLIRDERTLEIFTTEQQKDKTYELRIC